LLHRSERFVCTYSRAGSLGSPVGLRVDRLAERWLLKIACSASASFWAGFGSRGSTGEGAAELCPDRTMLRTLLSRFF